MAIDEMRVDSAHKKREVFFGAALANAHERTTGSEQIAPNPPLPPGEEVAAEEFQRFVASITL